MFLLISIVAALLVLAIAVWCWLSLRARGSDSAVKSSPGVLLAGARKQDD
ncbi:hypothetical protein [Chitinilyticum aquatile]|nr:hypothetical protein [Chitinilyticum aquatile]